MLYWGRAAGARPHDHVRHDIPAVSRRQVALILQHGRDAHPSTQAMGWADCRICGTALGSGDRTAFGFVWPEKAEHYVLVHDVWTEDCTRLLQRTLDTPPI